MPVAEWTQLLKELTGAVEDRNRVLMSARRVDAHISELTAQALSSGAPGEEVARVLARIEPLLAQGRPRAYAQDAAMPSTWPVPVPKQTAGRELAPPTQQPVTGDHGRGDVPLYTLREAWEEKLLPWTARTARTYMRQRSPKRGVPVPQGVHTEGAVRYTEAELRSWLTAWRATAGPSSACRSTEAAGR
ncbi:hypothetical protein CG747_32380 [Streptomyces sp. CB02959]|nr:hypothetical protein CG747_32380 [Streptomyces sp. CB02959]